jgi:hypothetical protein
LHGSHISHARCLETPSLPPVIDRAISALVPSQKTVSPLRRPFPVSLRVGPRAPSMQSLVGAGSRRIHFTSATYGNPRSLNRPLHLPPSPLQKGLNSAGTWHPRTLYRSIYEQLYTRCCMALCKPSIKHRPSSVYEKRRTASTVVAPRRLASFHVNIIVAIARR